MITNAEAIKTLEDLPDFVDYHSSEANKMKRIEAIRLAIDAMKAKSDAETVLKVAEKHGWPINPPAPWLGVGYNEWQVQHVSAPTLSELAAKLKESP